MRIFDWSTLSERERRAALARPSQESRAEIAKVAPTDLATRQLTARCHMRHDITWHEVGRASDNCCLAFAEVDFGDLQRLTARVRLEIHHAPEPHAAPILTNPVHVLHFEASHRQSMSHVGDRHVDFDQLAQPAERHLHRNCSRKRKSLA